MQLAQTRQDASGQPAGCYPAADVQGTTLTCTAGSSANTLASVTVNFNVHTDSGGTQRDGFIQITCQAGGPTSNFAYSTIGDQGHQSQYEIDTTADCSNAGGGDGPQQGYWCMYDNCYQGPKPPIANVTGGPTPEECESACGVYVCANSQCVPGERGVNKSLCEAICK